ncbi:hypothetical protein D3C85_823680 [compost metagenome]
MSRRTASASSTMALSLNCRRSSRCMAPILSGSVLSSQRLALSWRRLGKSCSKPSGVSIKRVLSSFSTVTLSRYFFSSGRSGHASSRSTGKNSRDRSSTYPSGLARLPSSLFFRSKHSSRRSAMCRRVPRSGIGLSASSPANWCSQSSTVLRSSSRSFSCSSKSFIGSPFSIRAWAKMSTSLSLKCGCRS